MNKKLKKEIKKEIKKWTTKETILSYLISTLFVVVCFAIVIFRVGFPYHKIIAVGIYIASWVLYLYPLCKNLDRRRIEALAHNKEITFIRKHKYQTSFVAASVAIIYLLIVLFPGINTETLNISKKELTQKIETDEQFIQELTISLQGTHNKYAHIDLNTVSANNYTELNDAKQYWIEIIDHILPFNRIIAEYQHFYQIDPIRYGRDLHERAFLIGYSAFTLKHATIHNIATQTKDNQAIKALFNGEIPGIGANTFEKASMSIINPNDLLRLKTGYIYLQNLKTDAKTKILAESNYNKIDSSFLEEMQVNTQIALDIFENQTMSKWLPIQKEISLTLSETRFKNRERNLISIEQLEEANEMMEPGDLLLERKNWYISNASMPGFWTHVAFYLGDLDKLNTFFADEAKAEFGNSFIEHIKEKYPQFYADKLQSENKDGFAGTYRTIEGKAPGIIQLSLEDSANADYLAVLRPKRSKTDRMNAVIKAIENYRKPYDFNFDFSTDDALVCSELFYKAYNGSLKHTMRTTAGRNLVAPNHMAEDFDNNYNTEKQQYDFILFLDGSEKRGEADYMGINEFRRSWQRPKYDFILHY